MAFGPSLIDICAILSRDKYAACQRYLNLMRPGWRRLDDYSSVRQLIQIMSGQTEQGTNLLQTVNACPNLHLGVGSTTLGMLNAMPIRSRVQSTFISTLGRVGGGLDPLSQTFTDALSTMGIRHVYTIADGNNPVGFVLSGQDEPEKTLATYPGQLLSSMELI